MTTQQQENSTRESNPQIVSEIVNILQECNFEIPLKEVVNMYKHKTLTLRQLTDFTFIQSMQLDMFYEMFISMMPSDFIDQFPKLRDEKPSILVCRKLVSELLYFPETTDLTVELLGIYGDLLLDIHISDI